MASSIYLRHEFSKFRNKKLLQIINILKNIYKIIFQVNWNFLLLVTIQRNNMLLFSLLLASGIFKIILTPYIFLKIFYFDQIMILFPKNHNILSKLNSNRKTDRKLVAVTGSSSGSENLTDNRFGPVFRLDVRLVILLYHNWLVSSSLGSKMSITSL